MEKPIRVTKHAADRVLQRFRLFMLSHEREHPSDFILKEYKKAARDLSFDLIPFYKHKIEEKHGSGAFFAHSQYLTFMCNETENEIVIRTVIKKFEGWKPF